MSSSLCSTSCQALNKDGVNRSKGLSSAKKNMQSAAQNPEVIEEYLQKEMEKGNILGPFSPSMMPAVHINRFGVIPKNTSRANGG